MKACRPWPVPAECVLCNTSPAPWSSRSPPSVACLFPLFMIDIAAQGDGTRSADTSLRTVPTWPGRGGEVESASVPFAFSSTWACSETLQQSVVGRRSRGFFLHSTRPRRARRRPWTSLFANATPASLCAGTGEACEVTREGRDRSGPGNHDGEQREAAGPWFASPRARRGRPFHRGRVSQFKTPGGFFTAAQSEREIR